MRIIFKIAAQKNLYLLQFFSHTLSRAGQYDAISNEDLLNRQTLKCRYYLKKVISYDSIYIFSSVDAVSVRHYVCVFSRKSLVILTLSFGRASKRQRSCYHTYVQVANKFTRRTSCSCFRATPVLLLQETSKIPIENHYEAQKNIYKETTNYKVPPEQHKE